MEKRQMRTFASVLFGVAVIAAWSLAIGYGYAQERKQKGYASWYSRAECVTRSNPDALMANGRPLDASRYTCASWFHRLGTVLRVTADSGRSVDCVVTDRGPARRLVAQGRVIDLSRAAFARLAPLSRGLVPVTVEEVR